MLTKMELLIMASVNARFLALEEQVSGLTHTLHMLRERCKDTSSSPHEFYMFLLSTIVFPFI